MVRAFERYPEGKVLYLSPMRALCTEKAALWTDKMRMIGKNCIELIGGNNSSGRDSSDYESIEDSNLLITTPEKWDFLTRSTNLIDSIGLILVNPGSYFYPITYSSSST